MTVAAAVINLMIFFIDGAAGASFSFLDRGTLRETSAWRVIIATVLPMVLGTGLAALLALRWPWVIRSAQVVGRGPTLLMAAIPFMIDADGTTQVALALLHVVSAVAVVVTLEAIRSGTKASRRVVG